MTHPTLTARYLRVRRSHSSIGVPGELTAEQELRAIDPHGILDLAVQLGEERAAQVLRVRVEAMASPTERQANPRNEGATR